MLHAASAVATTEEVHACTAGYKFEHCLQKRINKVQIQTDLLSMQLMTRGISVLQHTVTAAEAGAESAKGAKGKGKGKGKGGKSSKGGKGEAAAAAAASTVSSGVKLEDVSIYFL